MKYLHWDEKKISDFSPEKIDSMYENGYVFTRIDKGVMHQTRSLRIDLSKFSPSSENRRILKKVEDIVLSLKQLPLSDYDWTIGKLAKDFYDTKFESGIMSAQKIKEMLTERGESNFNTLFCYEQSGKTIGYTIAYLDNNILHYSYPFYNLSESPKDMGLGMMTKAIQYAKDNNIKYVYLGSLQRPNDTYKLQFEGIEWFDGKSWNSDISGIKDILDNK